MKIYRTLIAAAYKKKTGVKLSQMIFTLDFRKEKAFTKFTDVNKKVTNKETPMSELGEVELMTDGIIKKSKINKEDVILIACIFNIEAKTDDIKIFYMNNGIETIKQL